MQRWHSSHIRKHFLCWVRAAIGNRLRGHLHPTCIGQHLSVLPAAIQRSPKGRNPTEMLCTAPSKKFAHVHLVLLAWFNEPYKWQDWSQYKQGADGLLNCCVQLPLHTNDQSVMLCKVPEIVWSASAYLLQQPGDSLKVDLAPCHTGVTCHLIWQVQNHMTSLALLSAMELLKFARHQLCSAAQIWKSSSLHYFCRFQVWLK